jgi:beta-xylosidase
MKHFRISVLILFLYTVSFNFIIAQRLSSFHPGEIWPDNKGAHINAHGGGFIFNEGKYYWFGEHKVEGKTGNRAMVGVHCYSSTDLYNWNDEGIALSVLINDTLSPIAQGCVLERPKVIYNRNTKKYVMWFHLELKGKGYSAAQTGVAISDKVTGPYNFLKAARANIATWPVNMTEEQKNQTITERELKGWSDEWKKAVIDGMFVRRDFEKGQMARDMTLFVDDDGKAYHIHASEENLTLHISELSDDYTSFTGKYTRVFPAGHREAPAIFKYKGKYYLITSGCTGWAPNAARSAVAESIWGPWKELGNPCIGVDSDLTFHSQSTAVIQVHGKKNAYIFVADKWNPEDAIDGRYIFLPLKIKENGNPELEWYNEWNLNFFNPKID